MDRLGTKRPSGTGMRLVCAVGLAVALSPAIGFAQPGRSFTPPPPPPSPPPRIPTFTPPPSPPPAPPRIPTFTPPPAPPRIQSFTPPAAPPRVQSFTPPPAPSRVQSFTPPPTPNVQANLQQQQQSSRAATQQNNLVQQQQQTAQRQQGFQNTMRIQDQVHEQIRTQQLTRDRVERQSSMTMQQLRDEIARTARPQKPGAR
jgi:hypothetical protein